MIWAKFIDMVFKVFFKHPKVMELFDYKDKPNELDVGLRDLEKKVTDDAFRITAAVDMIKAQSESVDKLLEGYKSINKLIENLSSKLNVIDKIAHPPGYSIEGY